MRSHLGDSRGLTYRLTAIIRSRHRSKMSSSLGWRSIWAMNAPVASPDPFLGGGHLLFGRSSIIVKQDDCQAGGQEASGVPAALPACFRFICTTHPRREPPDALA